jgi:hypothetical protein
LDLLEVIEMAKQERRARPKRLSLKATLVKLREVMRERGLTEEEVIVRYLIPRLSATKTIVAQYKGEVTDVLEVPDHAVTLEAVEMFLQLHGAFPSADPTAAEPQGMTVIVAPPPPRIAAFDGMPSQSPSSRTRGEGRSDISNDPRPPNGLVCRVHLTNLKSKAGFAENG